MLIPFLDTCTIEHSTGIDGHHEGTFGDPITVKCNYREVREVERTGDNIITTAWLAFPPKTTLNYRDRITLPDGTQPKIASIRNVKSLVSNRTVYIKVELGDLQATGGI